MTEIGRLAFSGCHGLTGKVRVPSGVTTISGYMFSGCGGLNEIALPDGVTTIGEWAFSRCVGLREFTIPAQVAQIDYRAFGGCTALRKVTSLNTEPPACGINPFNGVVTSTCVLLVPKGAMEVYSQARWWSDFKHIKEIECD